METKRAAARRTTRSILRSMIARPIPVSGTDSIWDDSIQSGSVQPPERGKQAIRLTFEEIEDLPVRDVVEEIAHLYLWVPNALLAEGLQVMKRWGFQYKTNLIWYKVRQDGGPDRRGVGFYFRNVTEMVLFGRRQDGTRQKAGKYHALQEERAQPETRRAVRNHRSVQPRTIH